MKPEANKALSDGLHHLKTEQPGVKADVEPYYYFFCEAGEDGRPFFLVRKKDIPPKERDEILVKAKKNGKSNGRAVTDGKELILKPKGTPPNGMARAVQVAVRDANAMIFSAITLEAPAPDASSLTPKPQAPPIGKVLPEIGRMSPERRNELKALTVKSHPDALQADDKVALLLAKRDEIADKLSALVEKPDVTEEEVARDEAALKAIQAKIHELQTLGFKPKELDPKYRGEDQKHGWRADNARPDPEPPVQKPGESDSDFGLRRVAYEKKKEIWEQIQATPGLFERMRNSTAIVTKYYDEAEREKLELGIDNYGRLVNRHGIPVTADTEFVMDAETGKLYKFTAGREETGKEGVRTSGDVVAQVGNIHHSSVLAGKDVASAGGIEMQSGIITKITNASGHYKPGVLQMIQCIGQLMKQGALISQEWVGADGLPLEGNVELVQERVMKLQDSVIEKLADDPDADVSSQLKAIAAAKTALAKIGASPSGKWVPALVQLIRIKKEMTGADVKDAAQDSTQFDEMSVKEFMTSGGGNAEQFDRKTGMQDELKAKMAGRAATLDAEAETAQTDRMSGLDADKFKPGADPTDKDLREIATNLKTEYKHLDGEERKSASTTEDAPEETGNEDHQPGKTNYGSPDATSGTEDDEESVKGSGRPEVSPRAPSDDHYTATPDFTPENSGDDHYTASPDFQPEKH